MQEVNKIEAYKQTTKIGRKELVELYKKMFMVLYEYYFDNLNVDYYYFYHWLICKKLLTTVMKSYCRPRSEVAAILRYI